MEKFRKELEGKRQRFLRGSGTGYFALDRSNKTTGSFSDTEFNRETGETTLRTFRVHHGFPLEITERLRMKDNDGALEYEFHVSGLGNEHRFVLQFKAEGSQLF